LKHRAAIPDLDHVDWDHSARIARQCRVAAVPLVNCLQISAAVPDSPARLPSKFIVGHRSNGAPGNLRGGVPVSDSISWSRKLGFCVGQHLFEIANR
jgi:hypothetical protein